jgi:valyl-tRNA synthetase
VSRTESDEQLIEELADITADVTKDYEEYRIYLAAEKLYHYAWDRLAAEILEDSKKIFTSGNAEEISSRKATLLLLLQTTLTLLHPIIPFVTEEIYQSHPLKKAEYLMIENWPV